MQGTKHNHIPKLDAHRQRDCPVLSIAHTATHSQGSLLPFEADNKALSQQASLMHCGVQFSRNLCKPHGSARKCSVAFALHGQLGARETSSLWIIQGPGAAGGLGAVKARGLHLPVFPNTHSSKGMDNVWDNFTVL